MYPNSTEDDARLPYIGSRAIPHSSSNKTGCLSYFSLLHTFPEKSISNLEEHQFQQGTRVKLHGRHIIVRREWIPRLLLKRLAKFPQAPQEYPSLSNRYVRGTLSLLPQIKWIPRCPDSKEGRISLQLLECRLVFHHTR